MTMAVIKITKIYVHVVCSLEGTKPRNHGRTMDTFVMRNTVNYRCSELLGAVSLKCLRYDN